VESIDVICKSIGESRVSKIKTSLKSITTPTYFPAISSFGMKHEVLHLTELLHNIAYPTMLVSAYDTHFEIDEKRQKLLEIVNAYSQNKDCILFLDSGQYESYYKRDENWAHTIWEKELRKIKYDLYTNFDIYRDGEENQESFLERHTTTITRLSKEGLIPIFHSYEKPDDIITSVQDFLETYPLLSNFIAIPERDCGGSIIEKAITVHNVRKAINESNPDMCLHILGCGHPLSILIFTICGADSFDSLDWIRYVLRKDTMSFDDFSYLDLISCECDICTDKKVEDYDERVFLHNLLFYKNFMNYLQQVIEKNRLQEYIEKTSFGVEIIRILQEKGIVS